MRIRLQRHIRTKTHKKCSATVSPYVGIIQIRFRVKEHTFSQPALHKLPFVNIYYNTFSAKGKRKNKKAFFVKKRRMTLPLSP